MATDDRNAYWTNGSSTPHCGLLSYAVRYAPLDGGDATTIVDEDEDDSPVSVAVDEDYVHWAAGTITRAAKWRRASTGSLAGA